MEDYTNLISVIAGIISIITLIVFFVMAADISMIKRILKAERKEKMLKGAKLNDKGQWICTKCGTENDTQFNKCRYCGKNLLDI